MAVKKRAEPVDGGEMGPVLPLVLYRAAYVEGPRAVVAFTAPPVPRPLPGALGRAQYYAIGRLVKLLVAQLDTVDFQWFLRRLCVSDVTAFRAALKTIEEEQL